MDPARFRDFSKTQLNFQKHTEGVHKTKYFEFLSSHHTSCLKGRYSFDEKLKQQEESRASRPLMKDKLAGVVSVINQSSCVVFSIFHYFLLYGIIIMLKEVVV